MFIEQRRQGMLEIWAEPFTVLRVPRLNPSRIGSCQGRQPQRDVPRKHTAPVTSSE